MNIITLLGRIECSCINAALMRPIPTDDSVAWSVRLSVCQPVCLSVGHAVITGHWSEWSLVRKITLNSNPTYLAPPPTQNQSLVGCGHTNLGLVDRIRSVGYTEETVKWSTDIAEDKNRNGDFSCAAR